MKAIIITRESEIGIRDVPIPSIPDGALLVKTKAVAINPTDWKHVHFGIADVGARCGCDFAGVVEELGAGVDNFKKGDRVFGFCHGGNRVNHDDGAFADYLIAKPGPLAKIPDNITDTEAATLPVAIVTVGQGLYKLLTLPLPTEPAPKPFPIFIYGGSTATGVIGIQFAKASGLEVIATASPRNFDYLRSLGVDLVVDYNSPTCVQEIRDFAGGPPEYAWNCIGSSESIEICELAMGGKGREKIASIIDVEGQNWTLGYDAFGETFVWRGGQVRHGDPEERAFATRFLGIANEMLAEGKIKPIRRTVNWGGSGLEGVIKGMDQVKTGLVSAEKLVYTF